MPVSVTPTEAESIRRRARKFGFSNPARYLLALHEAEQRLGLGVKENFSGERWFVDDNTSELPEDKTIEEAILQLYEDSLPSNVTPLPHVAAPENVGVDADLKKRALERLAKKRTGMAKKPQ